MEEFIGTIKLFAGNFAPKGWLFCDGSLLKIQSNSALFSILGTTYGGNGMDTFALPDLRGRMALGAGTVTGQTSYPLGIVAGNRQTSISQQNLPSINSGFQFKAANQNANVSNPTASSSIAVTGKPEGRDFSPLPSFIDAAPDTPINPQAISYIGQNTPMDTMPPYVGLNYIICIYGVYPPRD